MQYQAGWCSEHGSTVKSMADELKVLGFSTQAIKDFNDHWNEKLPKVDTWCVYPQYNRQLDKILPVKLSPIMPFIRVGFVHRRGRAHKRPKTSSDTHWSW